MTSLLQIPDELDLCKLDHVPFQQMFEYMSDDFCSGCACKAPTDAECVDKCSAKKLFIGQVRLSVEEVIKCPLLACAPANQMEPLPPPLQTCCRGPAA